MIDLQRWRDDGVTISLLLTRRCNFECAHCMYECGSHWRGYMSNEVLCHVKSQVRRLEELGIRPNINLVGGEPTLNMGRFEEILNEVMRWDVDVQMTTNGWWLHEDPTARRFFNAAARYVDRDGRGLDTWEGRSFSVRISDDEFHDAFRPSHLRDGRMKQWLAGAWEDYDREVIMKERIVCPYCERECDYMPDDEECPECGDAVEHEQEELLNWDLPAPAEGDPWIYTDRRNGSSYHGIIPVGRASHWGGNDVSCRRYSNVNGLGYLPNGKLMDVCCKGSWCEFGTVEDDPLLLLELAERFVKEMRPCCAECREFAVEWKRGRFRWAKEDIQREIGRMDEAQSG